MEHEALGSFGEIEHFNALLVVFGAERGGDQGLRFAAREDSRSVGAGKNADFAGNGANLIEGTAIGTAVLLQHLVAEDALFQMLEDFCGFGLLRLFGIEREGLLLGLIDAAVAFELAVLFSIESIAELVANSVGNFGEHGFD